MTKTELIKKVKLGEPIITEMFTKNTWYKVGESRITERQYKMLKEYFEGLLEMKHEYSPAISRTKYTLKK